MQASSAVDVPSASVGGMSAPGMSMSASSKVWKNGMKVITITFMKGEVSAKARSGSSHLDRAAVFVKLLAPRCSMEYDS